MRTSAFDVTSGDVEHLPLPQFSCCRDPSILMILPIDIQSFAFVANLTPGSPKGKDLYRRVLRLASKSHSVRSHSYQFPRRCLSGCPTNATLFYGTQRMYRLDLKLPIAYQEVPNAFVFRVLLAQCDRARMVSHRLGHKFRLIAAVHQLERIRRASQYINVELRSASP